MFKYFRCYTIQRDGSVVTGLRSVTFLKERSDIGHFQLFGSVREVVKIMISSKYIIRLLKDPCTNRDWWPYEHWNSRSSNNILFSTSEHTLIKQSNL